MIGAHVTELVGRLSAAATAAGQSRKVYDHVPEEPAVPCFIVQGAPEVLAEDPEATMRGERLVTLEVVVLERLDDEHDNATATRNLWDALDAVAAATEDSDWWLVTVTQPTTLQTLYWQHHGVTATVRTRT